MHELERRMQFVFALRSHGVTNADVLKVMEALPRREFVEGIFQDRAYEDLALPIACGQTISQPSVVGLMTQALQVDRRSKVLEVGTGSGYQAAILSRLARRVYTVERHRHLARAARQLFERLELTNITVVIGDGSLGLPEQAPFDRILLDRRRRGPAAGAARPAARRRHHGAARRARATRCRR